MKQSMCLRKISFFCWVTLLSKDMVLGFHFQVVKWAVKASQRSFHEYMLPSKRVLNHVIADIVKIGAKSFHLTTPWAW